MHLMPTYGQLGLMALGVLAYAAAAVAAIRRFRGTGEGSAFAVLGPLILGLAAGAGLLIWRVVAGGTLLVVVGFDAMILIAWLIALEVLIVGSAGRLGGVDAFLLPVAAVLQACSVLMIHSGATAATHLHQWHIIGHALVISVAGACFVASGVAGVAYLVVHRAMRNKHELSVLGRLPPLETLERFGRWMVAAGYPLLTFGILTGICGIAHAPAGRREHELIMASGTLVLWVMYGAAMVIVWLRPRLRGPRAAALATTAAALTLMDFVSYLIMRSYS